MDAAARAHGREAALARLIQRASGHQPLLLIVEDVHWADAETIGHLAALARSTAGRCVVLVLSTRVAGDPLDAGWRAAVAGSFQITIDLAPLGPTEAETIARSFATGEEFAAKCVERAGVTVAEINLKAIWDVVGPFGSAEPDFRPLTATSPESS
jgi:hypothetical protein